MKKAVWRGAAAVVLLVACSCASQNPPQTTTSDNAASTPAGVVSATSADSATPTGSGSAGTDQERIIRAVKGVEPSVVALAVVINGTRIVPADPFSQLFGGSVGPTAQRIQERASGSGFVYDRSGLIVTNSHVVHNASRIVAIFANGDRQTATRFAEDVGADLALVKVANYAKLPPPVELGTSRDVVQGEWAIAIGEPFELEQTVTVGVVSGFNRSEMIGGQSSSGTHQFKGLLQTSAPINPGNSGGPLIDFYGHLIGVNQSTADPASGAQGIGFAIPVDAVRTTVVDLIAHPRSHNGTSSGFIGVQLQPLNDNVRQQLGYTGEGALIAGVIANSAADHANLNPGDVIQQIDGTDVKSVDDVLAAMQHVPPGNVVHLRVWRAGQVRTVNVTVGPAELG
jgi:S1-C subfamily serine protease